MVKVEMVSGHKTWLRNAVVGVLTVALLASGCSNSKDQSTAQVSAVPVGSDATVDGVDDAVTDGSSVDDGVAGDATPGADDPSAEDPTAEDPGGEAGAAGESASDAEPKEEAPTPNSFEIAVPAAEGENSLTILEDGTKSTFIVKNPSGDVIFERTYDNSDDDYLALIQYPEGKQDDLQAAEVVITADDGTELIRLPFLEVLNTKNDLVESGAN